MRWLICLVSVIAPGMSAFKKELTTWSKLIDTLATFAQSAIESSISALNGTTLKDIKTLQESVRSLEANSQSLRNMRRVNSHTKIGTKKDPMTFKLLKASKVQANAKAHAHIIIATRAKTY